MSIFEIVVGDMVQLNIGDQVSSCFSHHRCGYTEGFKPISLMIEENILQSS